MRRFYSIVLKYKKTVLFVFSIAFIISLVLMPKVSVNYELLDYLPAESLSTVALDVMDEEYENGIPNMRIMIRDVSIPEALEYKERIEDIDGVLDVIWLDNVCDIHTPYSMIDDETKEAYYKDGCALFSATVDANKKIPVVQAVKDMDESGKRISMDGQIVYTAIGTLSTIAEIKKILILVIPLCFLILTIATDSYFEPVLFMLTIGIAIVLNKGSDLIFGEISFVTNAAGAVLQLAVSMDYSIFIIHRFSEEREHVDDVKEAMLNALEKSTKSIFSSGLTTLIGFLALLIMRFRIGPDLGRSMAKGICFSMISVLILLPVLTMYTYRLIDRTRHRMLLADFRPLGRFIKKTTKVWCIIFALIIIPSFLAAQSNAFSYGQERIFAPDTEIGKERIRIEEVFGKENIAAILVPKGDVAKEKKLSEDLSRIKGVGTITSYADTVGREVPKMYLDDDTLSLLDGKHVTRFVISLNAPPESDETFELVKKIEDTTSGYYDKYYMAGDSVGSFDMKNTVTEDNLRVNFIAILSIFLILLFNFRSLTLPVILVLVIETSIWVNLSISYFGGSYLFFIAHLMISSLQLGATVDYAILLTSRYMENRRSTKKNAAVEKTINETALSIFTSGTVLTLGGSLLGKICTNGVIGQLGFLVGRGAVISTIMVLFVLPGLLEIFDSLIQKTTKNIKWEDGKDENA